MNSTELLDQFVLEARECLETIGQRLLQIERDPSDASLLADLFRSVHTLKGNCGLFEFGALERVVHAAEDLLDRVRDRRLDYGPALADALLDAMDYSVELIDGIERHGRIDEKAAARSTPLAAALRALMEASPAAAPAVPARSARDDVAASGSATPAAAPDWLARVPPDPSTTVALRYRPEPECFFKGEDPWRLACTTPGLLHVHVDPQSPWPAPDALDDFDCYRCNLELVIASAAPPAEVREHFRCVPEQVEWIEMPASAGDPAARSGPGPGPADGVDADRTHGGADAATPAESVVRARAATLWAEQLALLARPGLTPGTLAAVSNSLANLLCAWPERADALAGLRALPAPPRAADLLAWGREHGPQPGGPPAFDADVADTRPAPPTADAGPRRTGGAVAAGSTAGSAAGDDGAERSQRVLKVGQEKVDRLMDLIGEMVVAKNGLPYLAQRAENVFGQRELAREIKAQYAVINRIAEDMQHAIMQVRMLPVGTVFQRFGRLVRDISKRLGKDVRLVVEGEETEADKNVIESLADPLIHIVRNSLDHGIETPEVRRAAGKPAQGTIRIVARQEGDRVTIEIADDGAGVDPRRVRDKAVERGLIPADRAGTLSDEDAVQLVFLPGFSTAESVTDLSGRGVGMDVVRTAVERINGSIELQSRLGRGTSIRLSLPLSMAVTNVMVIESAGRRFGVPMELVVETVRVHVEDIHRFKQARTTVLRGRVVPLRPLNDLLGIDAEPARNDDDEYAVLVARLGSGPLGLLVDQFHGATDIILKPLEGVLAGLTGFAGTALMGDGSVLMVLNPKELA